MNWSTMISRLIKSRVLESDEDYEPFDELLLWMDDNPSKLDPFLIKILLNGFFDDTSNPDYMYSLIHGLNAVNNKNPDSYFKEVFDGASIIYPHAINWYTTILANGLITQRDNNKRFMAALMSTSVQNLTIIKETITSLIASSTQYISDRSHLEIVSNGRDALETIESLDILN
ncbi:hypothetical protein IC229_21875 [Spirosoma sp. BT702]|uniref:Immunity protein 30 domain-containing protein n=1 Tax=Spirosoma profusum TaxID=2771354 RepID=A0A926Y4J5_9BACT|nr:Imm30 family immunity protein [Spirosoma profusum]MBD2703310.1 hypothetical protein [Spirosoma profusum]